MVEQHWSYMDRFAATMIARGPTFTRDGTLTGSVHMLGLPGPDEARAFAFDEPGYQAGAYRDRDSSQGPDEVRARKPARRQLRRTGLDSTSRPASTQSWMPSRYLRTLV